MFVFNIKINKNFLFKTFVLILILLALTVLCFSIFKIFSSANSTVTVNDTVTVPEIANITSENYTNILKAVYDNLDTYIGQNISFCGYVYRVYDFENNQFVLARDMSVSSTSENLVVGFLCEYSEASNFQNGTWVQITGTIKKGHYHGEIPVIDVTSIEPADAPESPIVPPPDDTYIPTSLLF